MNFTSEIEQVRASRPKRSPRKRAIARIKAGVITGALLLLHYGTSKFSSEATGALEESQAHHEDGAHDSIQGWGSEGYLAPIPDFATAEILYRSDPIF